MEVIVVFFVKLIGHSKREKNVMKPDMCTSNFVAHVQIMRKICPGNFLFQTWLIQIL